MTTLTHKEGMDILFKIMYKKPNRKANIIQNRYVNNQPFHTIEIDTLFMPSDKNFRYILTAVDVCTRYKFGIPITNKTGKHIVDALEQIVKEARRVSKKPALKLSYISADSGSEINNKDVKKWCTKEDIKLNLVPTAHHLSLVENLNLNLARQLFKPMNKKEFDTGDESKEWTANIMGVLSDMNHTKHKILKFKPTDAIKKDFIEYPDKVPLENSEKDRSMYYPRETIVLRLLEDDEYLDIRTLKISNQRRRATDPRWDGKIYKVVTAYQPENEYWYHVIKDYTTDEIYPRTYNYWNLQPIKKDVFDAIKEK